MTEEAWYHAQFMVFYKITINNKFSSTPPPQGHGDEVFVLEAHPTDPHFFLSAGTVLRSLIISHECWNKDLHANQLIYHNHLNLLKHVYF